MDFGDFGDFGFWILGILDFWDFGDFGFWIFGTLCSRSLCAKFGFWNLGILDFGFWGFWILGILDFGFWGSWILEFGLGILDGHLVTKFWMLHKKRRLCTPNRVGGLSVYGPGNTSDLQCHHDSGRSMMLSVGPTYRFHEFSIS